MDGVGRCWLGIKIKENKFSPPPPQKKKHNARVGKEKRKRQANKPTVEMMR
jgi:hypothetical protein